MNNNHYLKIKVQISVLIIFLVSFQFFKCNSSGNTADKNNNNTVNGRTPAKVFSNNSYFPVAENMNWNYINEAPREETELFNVEISSVKSENGSIYAVFDSFPFFTKANEKTKVRIIKTGEVFVNE